MEARQPIKKPHNFFREMSKKCLRGLNKHSYPNKRNREKKIL